MSLSNKKIDRRDFLKMLALFSGSMAITPVSRLYPGGNPAGENIIILVFDAWSAKNMHMYGYKRTTMPNLEKFADHAIVYKNHYAASNFTVPGTASLLTGVYPWQHRAYNLGGLINEQYAEKQIFNALSSTHNTVGFSQNIYADQLVNQGGVGLEKQLPFGSFNLVNEVVYDDALFQKDQYIAFTSFENTLLQGGQDGVKGSLYLGLLKSIANSVERRAAKTKNIDQYAFSLPKSIEPFTLADLVDGLVETLKTIEQPSLVYFHFYTPHAPYSPYKKYFDKFSTDNFDPGLKPEHPLLEEPRGKSQMALARNKYDSYLASWDEELGRLFDFFDISGLKQRSHIFITSDHGEEFERGHIGHREKMVYEPVIKIPLIVSSPGISSRINVFAKTSNIDILPTITHLTNNPSPFWASGQVLPALGGKEDPQRELFTLDSEMNAPFAPLTQYSISLHYANYKMIKYQYPAHQGTEVYDLSSDPEELTDLYPSHSPMVERLEKTLLKKINEINKPYLPK